LPRPGSIRIDALLDVIIEPCKCNLKVWAEVYAGAWELHIGPCCESCEKLAIESARNALGQLPRIIRVG
jgi:hypothetical protein